MHTHCHFHFPFLLKSALRYAISFNILFKRFWKNEKLKWKNVFLIEIMRIIFFKWTLFIQSDRIIKKQVVKFIERSNALNLRSDTCKMWEFKFSTLSKKRHCKFQKTFYYVDQISKLCCSIPRCQHRQLSPKAYNWYK